MQWLLNPIRDSSTFGSKLGSKACWEPGHYPDMGATVPHQFRAYRATCDKKLHIHVLFQVSARHAYFPRTKTKLNFGVLLLASYRLQGIFVAVVKMPWFLA